MKHLSKILILLIILFIFSRETSSTVRFESFESAEPSQVEPVILETFEASISAYTSREAETDDTPFLTANGEHVYDGGIACPGRYKFGTKVLINERVYKCNDRMNKRYRSGNYFDIWFSDYDEAIEYGRRLKEVAILE